MTLSRHLATVFLGAVSTISASQFFGAATAAAGGAAAFLVISIFRAGVDSMLERKFKALQDSLEPNGGDNIRDQVDKIVEYLEIEKGCKL